MDYTPSTGLDEMLRQIVVLARLDPDTQAIEKPSGMTDEEWDELVELAEQQDADH